jgi:hypothetical protein
MNQTQKADYIFSTTAFTVQKFIDRICQKVPEKIGEDQKDTPLRVKIGDKTIGISCAIVDAEYDSHKLLEHVEQESEDAKQIIRDAMGFVLYAARTVFNCMTNTLTPPPKLDSEALPFTIRNVTLAVDASTATLHLAYVSDEDKMKIHLEHCVNILLEEKKQQTSDQSEEWKSNWKITQLKLDDVIKIIQKNIAVDRKYNENLKAFGSIGVIMV